MNLKSFNRKTVWIFQTGEPLHIDGGNPRAMRAMNLANILVEKGCKVVVWSSKFYHQEKKHRKLPNTIVLSSLLEYRLINSCGYKANLGFGRIIDHIQLGINLWLELKKVQQKPDVAFIGFPPIEFAFIANRWLQQKGIPTMLDVKDQWPLLFLSPFPAIFKPLARICFSPFFFTAKLLMRKTTAISTMAPGFLYWVYSFSGRNKSPVDGIYPLSPPAEDAIHDELLDDAFDWWRNWNVKKSDDLVRLIFIGSLSRAFNFDPIMQAAELAQRNNLNWQFVICGEGEESIKIRNKFLGCDNVVFPGWIDRPKQISLARMSEVGLAPYLNVSNFQLNMPNKIIDYLSLGIPILCPLTGDVENLILTSGVGKVYDENNHNSLFNNAKDLIANSNFKLSSDKCKKIYENNFHVNSVYNNLSERLISMMGRGL